ncbi:MAG: ABC transporter ATP-binding protein [Oscillospiraceae bacterium]|nr:ABC transporter ATP-binding protein [Oscillospiraceae bacterium]
MKDKSLFHWLIQLNRKQIWKILLLSALMVLSALAGVAVAVLTRGVVDGAIAGLNAAFWRACGLLAGFGAARILLYFFSRWLTVDITAGIDLHMKSELFRHILRKDYSAVGKYHSGVLMSRINDDVRIISSGLAEIAPGMLGMVVRLIAAFIVVLNINARFAVVFLILGAVSMLLASLLRKRMKEIHLREQEATERVSGYMQESVENLLVIKSFGAETAIIEREKRLQKKRRKAIRVRKLYSSVMSMLMNIAFYGGYLLGLIWSAIKIATGEITVGLFSSLIQLISQVETPLTSISGYMPRLAALSASAERIKTLYDLPEEPVRDSDTLPDYNEVRRIGLKNISFAYEQEPVLENADLSIRKGEFVVLAGVSGIGKSTLMKLLLGVYRPTDGELFLETDRKIPIDSTTRAMFAYVPQGNLLLSGTIRDNLCLLDAKIPEEKILHALEIADAAAFVSELPNGLNTMIGERGVGLSEGQLQRLAIARALLTDAPILLLDEATSALDEETERKLLSNLRSMTDKTCLLISHKSAALEVCDSAYRIIHGKIEPIPAEEDHTV